MRVLGIVSAVAVVGGIVLIVTGAPTMGAVVLFLGFLLGAIVGAVSMILRARETLREWQGIFSGGGPASISVVNIEPPQGVIFNRDATITLEVTGQDGTQRRVQKEIAIPIPQAFVWKMAGRMPTPLARFTQMGDMNLPSIASAEAPVDRHPARPAASAGASACPPRRAHRRARRW